MNTGQSQPFSIAVLAGGQSRRMGRDKALIELGGLPILQRVINAVAALTDDLFLVTNSPHVYRSFGVPMLPDVIPGKAALGGIYSAITHAQHHWTLVLACDMPLLNPAVITFLAGRRRHADVVVPLIEEHPETLHAFYSKNCLPAIEKRLQANRLKIIDFFDEVSVRYVTGANLQAITADFNFLLNLNTPDDLNRVKKIIAPPN